MRPAVAVLSIANDERLKFRHEMRGDARFEMRGPAFVTSLDHLRLRMQTRDGGCVLMGHS